jgi:hypothetical protein
MHFLSAALLAVGVIAIGYMFPPAGMAIAAFLGAIYARS